MDIFDDAAFAGGLVRRANSDSACGGWARNEEESKYDYAKRR
jgi:hypothetical protein